MLGFIIVGCSAIFLFFAIIVWHIFNHQQRPRRHSSLIVAEPLQPQVVCKSVPCQHPYFRVISEYCDAEIGKESTPLNEEAENEVEKNRRKFDYNEWSRSLSSISRKSSHPSSRRSSLSDVGKTPIINTKVKPYFVT